MKLTIGLVGCGRWGSNHLRVLQTLKSEARLHRVVVCDIDAKKLEAIEADATYASLSQMIEQEELDGLAIVTPARHARRLGPRSPCQPSPAFGGKASRPGSRNGG